MKKNHYISGEWNVTCDVCSKKIKAHEARQRWDGFIVCPDDFETRHPQDFVKAQTDKITVPFVRPLETPAFLLRETINESVAVEDSSFDLEVLFDRTPIDTFAFDESILFDVTQTLQEHFDISEGITFTLIGMSYINDTIIMQDSGFLGFNNYIEPTYFSEFYVGTTTLF
jgi:hypothetical protein